MIDKEGNELKMGDRVRFKFDTYDYEFIIESVVEMGMSSYYWAWGPEIPLDRRYTSDGSKNHHSLNFCIKIEHKKPWGDSKIKFYFK